MFWDCKNNLLYIGNVLLFFTRTLILIVNAFFFFKLNFLPSNLRFHSHEKCFINVFYSFIPFIILNTFKLPSSILLGVYIMSNESSAVIQFPSHLSRLTHEWIVIKVIRIQIYNCWSGSVWLSFQRLHNST